jgi:hypothetical chaperone protein
LVFSLSQRSLTEKNLLVNGYFFMQDETMTAPIKSFKDASDVVLAIDYGTSNSLLAATDAHHTTAPLRLDPSAQDPTVFRSVLYFPHGDLCFYGQKAIDEYGERQAEGRLVRSIKKYLPSESFIGSFIDNRMVRLEDLIGYFLLEMRKRACEELGGIDVTRALIGRPAKFSDDPVKDKLAQFRMEKAAKIAGFKEVSFLPEPLAAAFELRKRLKEMKTVLVVDLQGQRCSSNWWSKCCRRCHRRRLCALKYRALLRVEG